MSKTHDARQRELENALREGFVARRDKQPRTDNAYDRPGLAKAAAKLIYGEGASYERPFTNNEQAEWVEQRYEEGSCGTRSCWYEGFDMAENIARTQGERRLMEFPLQTVRAKSAAMPKLGDPNHFAMFGDDEVPLVKVSRADREYRERQRLASWEGRALAPKLADEQP